MTDVPPRVRSAMNMRAQGIGPREIGLRMGIPTNTAAGYLKQAARIYGHATVSAFATAQGWPTTRKEPPVNLLIAVSMLPDVRPGMVVHVHLPGAPHQGHVRAVTPHMVLLDDGIELARRSVHAAAIEDCYA